MVNLTVAPGQTDDRKLQAHILKWLGALANLTKKNDTTVNENWLSDIGQALLANLPSWVFTRQSCNYVASKRMFFPSFKEMLDDLKEWDASEDRKKSELKLEHQEAVKNASDLPQPTRNWVLSYIKHSSSNWKMDDANEPDFNEQKKREKWFEDFMKRQCSDAYKYLFPREWQAQLRTPERILAEKKGVWVSDAGVLNTINEIESIPNTTYKKRTIFHFKNAIAAYAPEWVGLVEEQYPGSYAPKKEEKEKKQGFFK